MPPAATRSSSRSSTATSSPRRSTTTSAWSTWRPAPRWRSAGTTAPPRPTPPRCTPTSTPSRPPAPASGPRTGWSPRTATSPTCCCASCRPRGWSVEGGVVRLLAPLGLVAALAAVPLVVWYLLRPRRTRVAVGSTFLWRAVDRPATAATPWQRFRGDPTFWLALLALAAVTFALARPAVPVAIALGDHTILVVDVSGSMLADEGGVTRAELARRAASELTEALAPGQEVSVIAAGPRASVALAASPDRRAITRALAGLPTSHAPADLADAFTLATSLQRPGQRTVVHLLTDRTVPADALAVAPPGLAISGVGSDRPNVALTRLTAAPLGGGDHQVLAQVRSYAPAPVRGTLSLAVATTDDPDDATVLVEQPVQLAARGTEDVVLTVPTGAVTDGAGVLHATIRVRPDVTGEVPDALPFDDTATTLLTAPRELRVAIAGPGNRFLELAFEALPDVTVTTSSTVPADLGEVDLLVIDRVGAPDRPTVPTWLVAPTSWPEGLVADGEVELPALTSQVSDHPLLADVDLTGLAVAEATRLEAPGLTALASAPDAALLLAGRVGAAPVVATPFELQASDLPLRPAFPLFVANLASWAVGGASAGTAVPAGALVTPDLGGAREVVVHAPDGRPPRRVTTDGLIPPAVLVDQVGTWRFEVPAGAVPAPEGEVGDDAAGDREVGDGGDAAPDPVLLPVVGAPDEGDLAAPRPASGATPISAETGDGTVGLRELAWPFAVLALVLLVLEWLWSQWLSPRVRTRRRGERRTATSTTSAPSGATSPSPRPAERTPRTTWSRAASRTPGRTTWYAPWRRDGREARDTAAATRTGRGH
ncbi:VWA domain-containing protein [Nitriliruptoraceae bacterium ZYF776]|nr:VWA domain-containing protein [Profundirhabdus halotolerans]